MNPPGSFQKTQFRSDHFRPETVFFNRCKAARLTLGHGGVRGSTWRWTPHGARHPPPSSTRRGLVAWLLPVKLRAYLSRLFRQVNFFWPTSVGVKINQCCVSSSSQKHEIVLSVQLFSSNKKVNMFIYTLVLWRMLARIKKTANSCTNSARLWWSVNKNSKT